MSFRRQFIFLSCTGLLTVYTVQWFFRPKSLWFFYLSFRTPCVLLIVVSSLVKNRKNKHPVLVIFSKCQLLSRISLLLFTVQSLQIVFFSWLFVYIFPRVCHCYLESQPYRNLTRPYQKLNSLSLILNIPSLWTFNLVKSHNVLGNFTFKSFILNWTFNKLCWFFYSRLLIL